jgi:hypothetical protein
MVRVFHVNRAGSEGSNVVLKLDSTHKVREPRPEAEAVEVSQQSSVMEADPAAASLVDVTLKCRHRCRRPVVGRIVQLDEELIVGEEGFIDGVRVLDVVDREEVTHSFLSQPNLCTVDEWLVNASFLRERDHVKPRSLGLRPQSAHIPQGQEKDAGDSRE